MFGADSRIVEGAINFRVSILWTPHLNNSPAPFIEHKMRNEAASRLFGRRDLEEVKKPIEDSIMQTMKPSEHKPMIRVNLAPFHKESQDV